MQNPTQQRNIEADPFEILREHDIMRLFEDLSFRRKWTRVFRGLRQPLSSGAHKWARLQMLRLLAPLMAVVVPLLLLLLISVLARYAPQTKEMFHVTRMDPTPREEPLDEFEPPEIERLEPLDPIDLQMQVVSDPISPPADAISPAADMASLQPADLNSVADIRSPVMLTSLLQSRTPGSIGAALEEYGGEHTVEAVLRALRWLAVNQNEDGSWGKSKPAMTSLALLAYLAHGETPSSDEFGRVVERGLRFLVGAQEADGRFCGRDGHDYTQPIAAYALAEAYGMTKTPRLRMAATKAIQRVVDGQNPSGGFNYNLVPSTRDDLSYAGWCVQALKAAQIAGLAKDVPGIKTAMQRAIPGIKSNFRAAGDLGGFGYTSPSATHGLSGVGVLALQFLGDGRSQEARLGLAGLSRWPFDWENPQGRSPVYYWYYNTQAYFQEGGSPWDRWNQQFSHGLLGVQQVLSREESGYVDHNGTPHETGFWDSPSESELTGGNGRGLDTVLCTLMLEVYYRNLRTFRPVPQEEIDRELGTESDLVIEIVASGEKTRYIVPAFYLARNQ